MTIVDWVLIIVWLGLTLGGFWKGAVRIIFGGGCRAVGLFLAVIAGAFVAVSAKAFPPK